MGFRSSYIKFKEGKPLTRKQAMEAQCFSCNGESAEQKDECRGQESCPLYPFSPWGKGKGRKNEKVSSEELKTRPTHGEKPLSKGSVRRTHARS